MRPGELRVFVAVPVADAARDAVLDLLDRVTADPAVREAGRLRWAVTDQLHLTIRFLGATPEARVKDVVAAVEASACDASPVVIRLAGAGAFPSNARPRVVWLGIAAGGPELAALAGRLGVELAARVWPEDERPFRAHLTLARADGVPGASRVVEVLAAAAASLDAAWSADRLVVYQSELGHGPARYRALAVAALGEGHHTPRGPLG